MPKKSGDDLSMFLPDSLELGIQHYHGRNID